MQPRAAALRWDLATAAKRIQGFVVDKSWPAYSNDLPLRSGVERQFEIAGETMTKLRRVDPETAMRVPNVHRIIGMRNILIQVFQGNCFWRVDSQHTYPTSPSCSATSATSN